MEELFKILKYKRPYGSEEEEICIEKHLDIIPGMTQDGFGNRMITLGENPTVLFSSHTDTVHRVGGMQKIIQDTEKQIIYKDDTECLGADDGAGMWLMIQMINEKIPGLYIFHRGEECGGLGSSYIARDTPEILDNITKAIAFDRRGTKDIISRQSSGMCCSQEFVTSLSEALGMEHSSSTGSFTDTANYTDLVEECTNVSCGYYSEHRPAESLDYEYLQLLLKQLLLVDFEALTISRKKGDRGYAPIKPWGLSGGYKDFQVSVPSLGTDRDMPADEMYDSLEYQDVVSFVMNNPNIAADMLYDQGLTPAEIRLAKMTTQGFSDW